MLPVNSDPQKKASRLERFKKDPSPSNGTQKKIISDGPPKSVVGQSNAIEKPYLRLTSEADPAKVRTLEVLVQSFKNIKEKWQDKKDTKNYLFIHDQFMSLRQDLTVQNIKNGFVVEVYETHASIAVEMGDFSTFSQCITVLFAFYEAGILGNKLEFISYSLLYSLSKNDYYAITIALKNLLQHELKDKYIAFSMEIIKIVQKGLYSKFFVMYKESSFSGITIKFLNLIRLQIRKDYLNLLQETYRDKVPVSKISTLLGFDNLSQCKEYLLETHHSKTPLTKK